ncbi:MAG: TPM domain-containing protein [Methylohalobius sp. ZOD2]
MVGNTPTIPSWAKRHLKKSGFDRIERAIREAERATRGEIVPMIVERSSTVGHVPVLLAAILLLLYFALGVPDLLIPYLGDNPLWSAISALFVVAFSWWMARFPWIQRALTSRDDRIHQTELRAEVAFYEAGLDKTEGETGILLFVSLMEHRAVVLADKAIARALPPETWDEVVNALIKGIKSADLSQGFEDAIRQCGELLAAHFPAGETNPNELFDHLILKD